MFKPELKAFFVIFLVVSAFALTASFSIVSSSTGLIRINSTSNSMPGQVVASGGTINLYFGGVGWYGSTVYLILSNDGLSQISPGDLIYSPPLSTSNITSALVRYYTTNAGVWTMGNRWVNGTFPAQTGEGNYYIKAFDQVGSVAVTDTFVSTSSVVSSGTLTVSPPFGAGGASIDFAGSGYPANTDVRISYLDPLFGWQTMTTVTSNASGQIATSSLVPDLQKSMASYDASEIYNVIAYRSDINGTVYSYANFSEYARGLKTVGSRTAIGLFGNGTDLTSNVKPMSGDVITISGKWFHPGAIYIRWDSSEIVGTVTGNQWANAAIIGTTATGTNGSFSTTVTIPSCAAGTHYLAIEDSQTRVIVKVSTASATASLTPSYGGGGVAAQLSGSRYPASTKVTISYQDPKFNTWNSWTSTTSDALGNIDFNIQLPDLGIAGFSSGTYPVNGTWTTLALRTEVNGVPYAYFSYNQYWRGLSQVGSGIPNGLYGNGTDLTSSVTARVGDSITISGKWFHPGVVYIRFDGTSVVGTVTSNEWNNAAIIGTTSASSTGSFQTSVTLPSANQGAHYLAIEDSQCRFIAKIYVIGTIVTPTIIPTTSPSSGPSSTPIPVLPSPSIEVSSKGFKTSNGYTVQIVGKLSNNGVSIPNASVQLSYSVTGGNSWQSLTMVKTQNDGTYTATWNPDVTGNYKIKAYFTGNSNLSAVNTVVDFALTPDSEQNIFSLNSNSTVTQFAFNSTSKELSFIASGPSGTKGYVDVFIPKTLISDISTLKTYVDGSEVGFSSKEQADSWLISFSYSHSEHKIVMSIGATTQPVEANQWLVYSIIAVLIILGAVSAVAFKRFKSRKHKTNA